MILALEAFVSIEEIFIFQLRFQRLQKACMWCFFILIIY